MPGEGCVAEQQNPSPPPPPSCEDLETAYITAYLTAQGSPLAGYASEIVQDSDADGLDDRFIVALAGVETTYGKYMNWGANNAFNNGHTNYPSFAQAIEAVINLIAYGQKYVKYQSANNIYSVYEEGNVKKKAPAQGTLDTIYQNQLGGNLSNVRTPRCPD